MWQHLGRIKFQASGGVGGFRHSSVCSISDWQHKKKKSDNNYFSFRSLHTQTDVSSASFFFARFTSF